MVAAFLLTLSSWQVIHARNILEWVHSYDVLRYDIEAVQKPRGLQVSCDLTLRIKRPGPLRLLITPAISGLVVERDGVRIPAHLGAGRFRPLELLLRSLGPVRNQAPTLLSIEPPEPLAKGTTATFRISYRWEPRRWGGEYADREGVQTHVTGFWVPLMADELFETSIRVTPLGRPSTVLVSDTWEGGPPAQLLTVFVGDLVVHERRLGERRLTVRHAPGLKIDAGRILDDLEAVLGLLERWLGPAGGPDFDLIVEPRDHPRAPSFCAGSYAVVQSAWLQTPRPVWIRHLAHECSHRWWGHRVPTTVIGAGGTWLREGLAEWTGVRAAGELVGDEAERELFAGIFGFYLKTADLRRAARLPDVIYANEPSLVDATYIDPPRVAYLKGALVCRVLEQRLGGDAFLAGLKRFATERAHKFASVEDFARALGGDARTAVAYYAGTTRLPDFELSAVRVEEGSAIATLRCKDPDWPGGAVACRITTPAGDEDIAVSVAGGEGRLRWKGTGRPTRIEVDPERIFLDPVRANNVWAAD
jgi:hypothetical protein